jgi:hypothetical protein
MIFGNDNIFNSELRGLRKKDTEIFESTGDPNAVADLASKQIRAQAMSCVLGFLENGDFSAQALDDAVVMIADMDGDGEITADEESYYNDLYNEVAYALIFLGADAENVKNFIDNADDDEGTKLGTFLNEKLSDLSEDDDTIISNYAVSVDQVTESVIKVVRDGKVVLKKKRIGRAHKMTAAQKATLKMARRKAFTSVAKMARLKSMKIRRKRGL